MERNGVMHLEKANLNMSKKYHQISTKLVKASKKNKTPLIFQLKLSKQKGKK